MSMRVRLGACLALALCLSVACVAACEPHVHPGRDEPVEDPQLSPNRPISKKLIQWGWDEPGTKFLREHIETMEQHPFDGLVFHVDSSQGGNFTWEMWGGRRFELDEFQPAIADLRATKFRRFTDRFLRVNVTPGSADWFDDEQWKTVQHNFGVAAQIAREGGCKGFLFDVEQYQGDLFNYASQKPPRPFVEYQAQVRQRGREWMREVNRHFPEITILLTFGYKLAQPSEGRTRAESRYGLLADFIDGMLEACTEQTVLVDAYEFSYPYKQPEQFRRAYETITKESLAWTAEPDKYRRQVRAAFGLWMDYDWRRMGWDVEDVTKNYFTPEQFRRAVQSALQTSDEYVWIYTEQPRWWTNERLPEAYMEALTSARSAVVGADPDDVEADR